MKFSRFLVGTLACTLFAACSNEENPAVDNGTQGQKGEQAFIAVNLVAPDVASRATYQEGTNDENAVTNARFYFFNGDAIAKVSGTGQNAVNYIELNNTTEVGEGNFNFNFTDDDDTNSDNVEKTSDAILVLDNCPIKPNQMVVILNPTGLDNQSKSLDDLEKVKGTYATSALTSSGKFVMSNSVYKDNGDVNNTVNVGNYIYENADAAELDPVKVYVERVVAKVEATQGTNKEAITNTTSFDTEEDFDAGSGETSVKAKITGWTIGNRSSISFLLKNLDNITTDPFENWNAPHDSRSYWAVMPTATDGNSLTNDKTWSEINTYSAQYCEERTGATSGEETVLLVAARLVLEGDENNGVTIAQYAGRLWTVDNLKAQFCSLISRSDNKIYYKAQSTDPSWTLLTKDQVSFRKRTSDETASYEAYDAILTLADNLDNYLFAKDSEGNTLYSNTEEVETVLKEYTALVYDNGKTYYYVPIKHAENANSAINAVVRNHWYKINITGVHGLGTPIPPLDEKDPDDEEEDIIPETPENSNSYLAAEINILSWNIISQDNVTLK